MIDPMPMDPNRHLRYYASLKSWLGAFIGSLVFVVIGALMYLSPRATHPEDRFMAVICMAFFGLGVVVFPIYAALDRREPLLELTPAGIQTRYMRAGHQLVSWADVATLDIQRGKPWRKNSAPNFYLIARGRPGIRTPDTEDAEDSYWDDPDWEATDGPPQPHTLVMQTLNQLFGTRKEKRIERECAALLEEIAEIFAPEVELYQIAVEREIQPPRGAED